MRKYILLAIAGAAAALASCVPRGETAGAAAGSPAAGASATASAPAAGPTNEPAASPEQLRERLISAGLGVPKEPIPADDFTLVSLAGATTKLSDFRGRVVFLNFWATWCPPCRAEMPSMERLHRQLRDQGLEIVAVDLQESRDTVRAFVKDNGLTFTVLLDADGAVGSAWGAQSIPTTYLIDRTGNIIARSIGGREWDSAEMVALFTAVLASE